VGSRNDGTNVLGNQAGWKKSRRILADIKTHLEYIASKGVHTL